MAYRIVLVDDHPIFCQGLNHLLTKEKDLLVVGEANDGLKAIELVQQKEPDIVIMDINMPNLNGIEATRQILTKNPDIKIVALSVHSGKQFVRDMLKAGATGYILKESIPEEMIEGVRTVLDGDVYLSKTISNVLVKDYRKLLQESDKSYISSISVNQASSKAIEKFQLSPRELDILDLLSKERLRNKEIAQRLFISLETVKKHLQNIYQKLNVKGRIEAINKFKEFK